MSRAPSLTERQALLALLPEPWCDGDYQLSALPSESNDNYLLSIQGKPSLVLRLAKADARSLGVNRSQEQMLYVWAAEKGLSPTLLWADRSKGIMLSEYFADADHHTPVFIDSLAEQLARLHATPPDALPFEVNTRCILEHISGYRKRLNDTLRADCDLNPDMDVAFEVAEKRWLEMTEPSCLCHSDLHRDNILFHEGRVFFLDWEYTAYTPAILDIASLAQSYAWDAQQLQRFYSRYLRAQAIPEQDQQEHFQCLLNELPVARFLLALQSYYWSMLHYGTGKHSSQYHSALMLEARNVSARIDF
ncbi:phosphotransferase [Pseudoteredinibacter isoporae]|uniref:phosphotransferase n=1 Tax=Pseudoteredinibacter isoporae TaxID=570281 RepID=UPI00310220D6